MSTLLKNLGQLLVHNPPVIEKGLSNIIDMKRMRVTYFFAPKFFYSRIHYQWLESLHIQDTFCLVEQALTIFNFGDPIVNKCTVPKKADVGILSGVHAPQEP